jgi:HlyD family secretion protein
MSAQGRRARVWAVRLAVLAALAAGGAFGVRRYTAAQGTPAVATAIAKQGDFRVLVRCRGSLAARKAVSIVAPTVPNLRIAWLTPAGQSVEAGDVIVRFDSSTAASQLMQQEAQLKQAEAALDQAVAQAKVTAEQDQTDLADARFNVERATIEAQRQALKGRIKGDAAAIDLTVTEQKLKTEEATVALHKASDDSHIASLTRQRDQARNEVQVTRSRIAQMELKAPGSGIVNYNMNYSGVAQTADARAFKVGDTVGSGVSFGQIPDITTLEMDTSIEESDRARVAVGQEVTLHVDALPEVAIPAKLTRVSTLTELRLEYPYTPNFRVYAAFPHPDSRLRPLMNGGMDIVVNHLPGAIIVPSKAVFTRDGKPVVYAASRGGLNGVSVKVLATNTDESAIAGIAAGTRVSLVDPLKQEAPK